MKRVVAILVMILGSLIAREVTFNGVPVTLNSHGFKIGDKVPAFTAVNIDMEEVSVGGEKDKVQVIAFVPSLNTGTCQLETIEFNKQIAGMQNVMLYVVSKDLPFAQQKFCRDNKITNIQTVSDYKDSYIALRYGTTISEPVMLEGLFARVVYIIDRKGRVAYIEKVQDIATEPDYKAIMKALKQVRGGY